MKIGVVGLGLIGGSIFKCLSENDKYQVIGISRSVKLDNVVDDYQALKECDFVFVCTPMNKTLEILDVLNDILDEKTIVTDVCSLKEFVTKKNYRFRFIPSHPMAGTENKGWENSFGELFDGATWAVTPKEDTSLEDFNVFKSIIADLGANTIITTPKEHDRAVALISHAPMVIAQALCKNIDDNDLAQNLASSGFRDTTRLALSNLEMAEDMVVMNEKNIKDAISLLNENIDNLLESDYFSKAEKIKSFRKKMFS